MEAKTTTKTRQPEQLYTRAAVEPSTLDEEARTVEVVFSTGADVPRRDWYTGEPFIERLSMDPKHVSLSRLNDGAPVLDTHQNRGVSSVLGVTVEGSASVKDGEGRVRLRFSERENVDPVWQDVRSGILRKVSVGYAVSEWQVRKATKESPELRTATSWEPHEVSLVPIPADNGAGVREYPEDDPATMAEKVSEDMPETENETRQAEQPASPAPSGPTPAEIAANAVKAERERTSAITTLCRDFDIEADQVAKFIESDASVDAVRTAVLETIKERQDATKIQSVTQGDGERQDTLKRDLADSISTRMGVKVEEGAKPSFQHASLIRMAARMLESSGVNTGVMSDADIAARALGTSDFADILYAVGDRQMRDIYESQELTHRSVFRQSSSRDFRANHRTAMAGGQPLEEVPENGEVKRRDVERETASYQLKSYAGIIAFTRKMMIDDDIGAIAQAGRLEAIAAAETEREVVWTNLILNSPQVFGGDVFSVANGNTDNAAAGSNVTAAILSAVRTGMRSQVTKKGRRINIRPRHIVCGAETETEWEQLLSTIYVPTTPSGVLPDSFRRSLMLHVEPSITDDAWYAFADTSIADTVEYAYLAGAAGPRMESRAGFTVDGVEFKVGLDFGAGFIDFRGAWLQSQT